MQPYKYRMEKDGLGINKRDEATVVVDHRLNVSQ